MATTADALVETGYCGPWLHSINSRPWQRPRLIDGMRHTFKFPRHVQDVIRNHVRQATDAIKPAQFEQEPDYVNALIGRLIGTPYDATDAYVSITATSVTSIGTGSAERWSGADFAITATIREGNREIRKAILTQAKLGEFAALDPAEQHRTIGQINRMRRLTRAPKLLEIPIDRNGLRAPRMLSGVRISEGRHSRGHSLADYFVARILTTLDGDTRQVFVDAVQDSSLTNLRVVAELRTRTAISVVRLPTPRPKVLA